MPRYCINWSFTGSTIIKADSLNEAQTKFDALSTDQLMEDGGPDFAQHEILMEGEAGHFDELAEDGEPGPCILTPENIHTADDCTLHDHENPEGSR